MSSQSVTKCVQIALKSVWCRRLQAVRLSSKKKTWQSLNIPFSLPGSFVNIRLRRRNPTTSFAFLQNASAFILFSANFFLRSTIFMAQIRLWIHQEELRVEFKFSIDFCPLDCSIEVLVETNGNSSLVIKSSFFWSQSALLRCWQCGELVSRAYSKNKARRTQIFSHLAVN